MISRSNSTKRIGHAIKYVAVDIYKQQKQAAKGMVQITDRCSQNSVCMESRAATGHLRVPP